MLGFHQPLHAQAAPLPEVTVLDVPVIQAGGNLELRIKATHPSGISAFEIEETDLPPGYTLSPDSEQTAETYVRKLSAAKLAARNDVNDQDYHVSVVATAANLEQTRFSLVINVATKQEIVNAITRAAHAYWEQRVVISRAGQIFYGYSGSQTVIDPSNPADRYYGSDSGFLPEPHIFHEAEDDPGHSGAAFGIITAYQASGDKFLLRAAKALGDTLLSIQSDLGCGGWWYDTGVIGYDRRDGSQTYRQTIDFGRWVNYYPWGGHGNVMTGVQNICTFDGVSFIPALYLLRLYQIMPADDPDRARYLEGAKFLADTIAEFKNVRDSDGGFYPYDIGGIPQVFPYGLMKSRAGVDSNELYPYDIPHNLMPTLNDHAMGNALMFLVEFWKEARGNRGLQESKYLEAVRLNIDYLIHVFHLNAVPGTGRGAWGSQYWVNDGSSRAGRVTWGRTLEPPGIGQFAERGEDILLHWWSLESDPARKSAIEEVLLKFMLFFKYDAPPVNSRPEWRSLIAGYVPAYVLSYDPGNIHTWYWWLWYNHDPQARDRFGNSVPLLSFVASGDRYEAYYGEDALPLAHNHNDHYPMIRNNGLSSKISQTLVEAQGTDPRLDLFHDPDDNHNYWLRYYFQLDPDTRLFRGWDGSWGRVASSINSLDPDNGFFGVRNFTINNKTYPVITDFTFQTSLRALAWGVNNLSGELSDSDGDGYSNELENTVGSDIHDSASTPLAFGEPPRAPSKLRAKRRCGGKVRLSWKDNANNEQGFRVERKLGRRAYSAVRALPADRTSFTLKLKRTRKRVSFRVAAFNGAGASAYSNLVRVKGSFPAPSCRHLVRIYTFLAN